MKRTAAAEVYSNPAGMTKGGRKKCPKVSTYVENSFLCWSEKSLDSSAVPGEWSNKTTESKCGDIYLMAIRLDYYQLSPLKLYITRVAIN